MSRSLLLLLVVTLIFAFTIAVNAQLEPSPVAHDQVEQGVKHTKTTLDTLEKVNKDTISQRKIARLNAPKIEYYHEVQKTVDKEVDQTARAIIDTPERAAYRAQVKADKIFSKTVDQASTILTAHNKMKPMKEPKYLQNKL